MGNIRVANVIEKELSTIANEPSSKSEEEFTKGRVHIKEVCPLEVIRGKLKRMGC